MILSELTEAILAACFEVSNEQEPVGLKAIFKKWLPRIGCNRFLSSVRGMMVLKKAPKGCFWAKSDKLLEGKLHRDSVSPPSLVSLLLLERF